jgi:hypothetical protein
MTQSARWEVTTPQYVAASARLAHYEKLPRQLKGALTALLIIASIRTVMSITLVDAFRKIITSSTRAFPFQLMIMIKTLLTTLVAAGTLVFTAQAQTTPTGTTSAGNRTAGTKAKSAGSTSKTGQSNSGNSAPNRSSTAGSSSAATSNNPVDATGKPMGATPTDNTSTVNARKPKN